MINPVPLRPAMEPVSARAPLIDDLMRWDEAARIILFECHAHISANVEPVLSTRRPEALHQLRVGLRRVRVALAIFGKGQPVLDGLRDRAKIFGNMFGVARDLDVFISELFEPAVAELEADDGFEDLRARADLARKHAWDNVVKELAGAGFVQFQNDLAAAAEAYLQPDNDLVTDAAGPLLIKQRKRAFKRGKHLAGNNAHERHRLRIALKKLRYTSEFFAPLYKKKSVRRFIEPLKDLQDLLGHLNDSSQARSVMGRLLLQCDGSEQAVLNRAAASIQGFHSARAEQVAKETIKRWKRFRDCPAFWE